MTHIFAFIAPYNDSYILLAGADGEGTNHSTKEKSFNHQKLFVIDDYFLMGTGSAALINSAYDQLNGQSFKTTENLADKVLEVSQQFRTEDEKGNKPLLDDSVLEFLVCGRNDSKSGFDIYQVDCNGNGFARFVQEKKEPMKYKRNWIGLLGVGSMRSRILIEALCNDTVSKYVRSPVAATDIGLGLLTFSDICDLGASVQGVNRDVQYGFMTLPEGFTTLYPVSTVFSDQGDNAPSISSAQAKAYLENLFNEEVTPENFWQQMEKAGKLYTNLTAQLQLFASSTSDARHFGEKLGMECSKMTEQERLNYVKDILIPNSTAAYDFEHKLEKTAAALLKRGEALKEI